MARDDWKYDDEVWEGGEEDDGAPPGAEKECRRCLHWIPVEATYCPWCGRMIEEEKKKS